MEPMGRPSGLWRHVLGCAVDHSLVLASLLFSCPLAGSFIMHPCLCTDPKTKALQIALVFFNYDKLMTWGNLRKEKTCLTFTSRSQSTCGGIQDRNLKQKSWCKDAFCRLVLWLLTSSCLTSFVMLRRTNFSGNSATHRGLCVFPIPHQYANLI